MKRITNNQIENLINNLCDGLNINGAHHFENSAYSWDSNPIIEERAYGGSKLSVYCKQGSTGESDITDYRLTKRELFYVLNALNNFVYRIYPRLKKEYNATIDA